MTVTPPRWTIEELTTEAEYAVEVFRQTRESEPLDVYLEFFEASRSDAEDVFERTVDLERLDSEAASLLPLKHYFYVLRYLVGPPISDDDLETVVGKEAFAQATKGQDPGVSQVVSALLSNIDSRRFPWVRENREPTEAERHAAVVATAALMANQKAQTARRTGAKVLQQTRASNALRSIGFTEVPARSVSRLSKGPRPGEFSVGSQLAGRRADLLIGLGDERLLVVECKSSGSEVNSIKRINDIRGVVARWTEKLGDERLVPAVTVAGVFSPQNLHEAQSDGITVWWGHSLDSMTTWIDRTR